jgi:hypothetical protein
MRKNTAKVRAPLHSAVAHCGHKSAAISMHCIAILSDLVRAPRSADDAWAATATGFVGVTRRRRPATAALWRGDRRRRNADDADLDAFTIGPSVK